MGIFRKARLKRMGISERKYSIIQFLHPYFEKAFKGDPDGSIGALALFADAHGKSDWDQLTDDEVDDFANLIEGIDFPIHPDGMARAGKFGCEACRGFYIELWKIATKPILDNIKSGGPPLVDPESMTREQWADLGRKMRESQEFLEES